MNMDLCKIEGILDLIQNLVPEGTEEQLEVNGITISLVKRNGELKFKVDKGPYNDEDIKNYVLIFKENIKKLGDSTFLKITEKFGKIHSTKDFNNLLNLSNYTEQEANKVASMIREFSKLTHEYLQREIQHLIELDERF